MNDEVLAHQLERTIEIRAERETVFEFFTSPALWASWWGAGSTIDPRPGGKLLIRYPGGTEVAGEVVEIAPPDRLVFTYGYVKGHPIPAGGSQVTIDLEALGSSTRLHLTHAFADSGVRDEHVQGWRYQLSLFANAVCDALHADAPARADEWFAAWSGDAAVADAKLRALAAPGIRMQDRFSAVQGVEEVLAHIAAARRFMPGIQMHREGPVRHCQGVALADWVARTADGQERGRGTNVFVFDARGRIEQVTGLWNASQ